MSIHMGNAVMAASGVRVQVPGKVMLAGEYAVLWQGEALAFAFARYLTVEAQLLSSDYITITSDLWPQSVQFKVNSLWPLGAPQPPLVASVLRSWQEATIAAGMAVQVRSQLRVNDGMGSSSAVRLGAALAVYALAEQRQGRQAEALSMARRWQIARQEYEAQLEQQGFASGYDIATQLMGGLIAFQSGGSGPWPQRVEPLMVGQAKLGQWIHTYGGGAGAPTTGVGGSTLAWIEGQGLKAEVKALTGALVAALKEALRSGGEAPWRDVFQHLKRLRLCFGGSPHDPVALHQALAGIAGCDERWSYKTTGAGGEDAILLLGRAEELVEASACLERLGWQKLTEGLSCRGASIEACNSGGA